MTSEGDAGTSPAWLDHLVADLVATAEIEDFVEEMLEIAAIVEEAVAPLGIHPIVVGGLAVAYWTPPGTYLTADIDVVMPTLPAAEERLEQLGFIRKGRYWTLPGREVFFEAPGTHLEPTPTGFDLVQTRSGRLVRVQAPEEVFGVRFEEFVAQGHADIFQQLLWLLGSEQLDQDALDAYADEPDYLRELSVSRDAYVTGLQKLREVADSLRAGVSAPEPSEIHELARELRAL